MTKVLVVDDSISEQRLISGLLRKCGSYSFRFATNGVAALEAIQEWEPEIVITDLRMPEMDGLALTRAIRARHPHLPVIVATGHGSESLAVEALEQGASSYVPKAELAQRLSAAVRQVIARSAAARLRQQLACRFTEFTCSLTIENDLALIGPLVDFLLQQMGSIGVCDTNGQLQVGVVLEELLRVAILSGNLEIRDGDVEYGRDTNGMQSEIKKRLRNPRLRRRKVAVSARLSKAGARFVVRSEGRGFLSRQELDLPEDALCPHRVMFLMRCFLDEIDINEAGNEVTLFRSADAVIKSIRERFVSHESQGDLLESLLESARHSGV